MKGQIYFKAQNTIQDPAKLYMLVQMIDAEKRVVMGVDVKEDIYEGLLDKNVGYQERRRSILYAHTTD